MIRHLDPDLDAFHDAEAAGWEYTIDTGRSHIACVCGQPTNVPLVLCELCHGRILFVHHPALPGWWAHVGAALGHRAVEPGGQIIRLQP